MKIRVPAVGTERGTAARGRGGRGPSGAALATVVVLGIVVTLLAHAALLLGRSMRHAGQIEVRATRDAADLRAEVITFSEALDSLGLPTPSGPVGALRLSSELLLVSATRAGLGWAQLLWAPDPATRVVAVEAGVLVAQLPSAGVRSRITSVIELPADCPRGHLPPLPSRWELRPEMAEAALDFGPIGGDRWRAHVPPLPDAPPAGRPVAAFATGPLHLVGTSGEGVLWVDGNLSLEGGAVWTGWVGVSGNLTLAEGSVIRGAAQVGGELEIEPGARIEVAACPVGRAVSARLPALLRPHALPGFQWPISSNPDPRR